MVVVSIVGGWIGSSIVTNLITSLISYVKEDQSKRQLGLKVELSRLQKTLPKIQAVMDAVERGHINDEDAALQIWLWQFRDAVDQAEDFIDEMDYYQLEEEIHGKTSKVSHSASHLKTIIKRAVHKESTLERLKNIVKGLDEVATDVGDFVNLVNILNQMQPLNTSNRDTSSLLPVEHKVVGRDDEKQEIINKLLNFSSASASRNFAILPIVGVGGIGKTTLAQLVYNDERTRDHFDTRVWVCVSNTFDVLSLTKKIYQLVVDKNHTPDNLQVLQPEILKSLELKKVLLVLDDVWNDNDRESWGKLLAPFRSVKCGSMILLTTRMKKVAKMMTGTMDPIFLEGLSEGYYWELFKNCSFGDEDPESHKKLQDIGRRIAKKLKCSPLAAKTVGGILRANLNDEHWEIIFNSEIWKLEQNENDVMPALRLSYQHLPSHLKPCFRFCSIFPQDYVFDKEKLVYMWMALGLLQNPKNGNRRPEDIGDEFLNDLVGKSFFNCETNSFGTYYVMHDLLHDLATYVSDGECFRIENSSEPILIPRSVRHLSINTSLTLPIPKITKLKYLRTLLLLEESNPSYDDFSKELKGMKSLRILESSCFNITDDCISNLKHLRYLHSHHHCHTNYQVPKSVNKLYHLQFLSFQSKFFDANEFCPPERINNLINLRRLTTPKSWRGKFSGIGRMSSLQILEYFYITEENGSNISELKNLRELHELGIWDLENVRRVEEASETMLHDKEHLQNLKLCWSVMSKPSCIPRSPELEEQVLDALQPNSNLKNLEIEYYMGRRSPHWMAPQSMSKLTSIKLYRCDGWEDMSSLGQLPYLESLELECMVSVKKIGSALDRGSEVIIFPSLRELCMQRLPALEEFYGGGKTTQWLPHLKSLTIIECPKLSVFPNLPCGLRELTIKVVSWVALPELWQGGNNNNNNSSNLSTLSSSPSSLISLRTVSCPRLMSLADGLLLHPELFTSLQYWCICRCGELTQLPIGGFEKFTSLKKIAVKGCPKLRRGSNSGSFLPPSLQSLDINNCDVLDPLPRAPADLNFLSEVQIGRCAKIISLPSVEVLRRWKALKELRIEECSELESLVGLQALSSLKSLTVKECPKLVAATSMSIGRPIESSVAQGPVEGSNCVRVFQVLSSLKSLVVKECIKLVAAAAAASSSSPSAMAVEDQAASSIKLDIDDLSLLCTMPLKCISAREVYLGCSIEDKSSALVEWVLRNRTSLQVLHINDVSCRQFPLVDLQSLSSLEHLVVYECRKLRSLPELPSSLKRLRLSDCPPELEERCLKDSGPDWPKIQHIPKVEIGKYSKEELATITLAEHRIRPRLEEDSPEEQKLEEGSFGDQSKRKNFLRE